MQNCTLMLMCKAWVWSRSLSLSFEEDSTPGFICLVWTFV